MNANRRRRPSYGWPILFTLLAAAAAAVILNVEMSQRQSQNAGVLIVAAVWLVAVIVWLVLFSRLPMGVRFGVLGGIVVCLGLVRLRGFTGDFVPIVEWRWEAVPADHAGGRPADALWTATRNDYGQFLGPNRDAVLTGVGLETDWTTHPPELMWRRPLGEGWSSFAIVGRRALTQEQDGPLERVSCYDLLSGERIWSHADTARYQTTLGGIGPRATPTVSGHRVYTVGATGIFNCLDLETGSVLWQRNMVDDFNAKPPEWGISCSPLVLGDRVIVAPGGTSGGSVAAYDTETGEPVWSGGNTPAAYSSPQLRTLAGREQILLFAHSRVVGHDPESGEVLWSHPWEGTEFCISQPVVVDGTHVFASTGYGVGGRLFQVTQTQDGMTAEMVWRTPRLKAKFANVIHREGVLYGLDDGVMTCIDVADGSRRWKAGRYGHGQIMMVDDVILVTTETGEVVMLEANPDAHVVLGSFQAVEGKTWNHPALAAPYLLVRNDQEAACFKLPMKETGTTEGGTSGGGIGTNG